LQLYDSVARGDEPQRDARLDELMRWLGIVDHLHHDTERPLRLREGRVDRDPFTSLVRRIGDTAIDYDPFTLQIRRLGDVRIDYDPFSHMPTRIGEIGIDYDPFDGRVRRIAGVEP